MTKCFECGRKAAHDHHVVPKARGGKKTVPLCGTCHGNAHMMGMMTDHRALCREAAAQRKRDGIHSGRPPYGFAKNNEGRLVPDKKEQHCIRQFFITPAKAGKGLSEIARIVNEAGIPSRMPKAKWSIHGVRKVLMRALPDWRIYRGICGKRQMPPYLKQTLAALTDTGGDWCATAKRLKLRLSALRCRIHDLRHEFGLEVLDKGTHHNGAPPYGYMVSVYGKLVPSPAERLVVDEIVRLYDAGMGGERIIKELKKQNTRNRLGKPIKWNGDFVRILLMREGVKIRPSSSKQKNEK